jgi:histidinol dehydrogenase
VQVINTLTESLDGWLERLESSRTAQRREAAGAAEAIIDEVRRGGDVAVARLVGKFDGMSIEPSGLLVSPGDDAEIDPGLQKALETAIERITQFHEPQKSDGYEIASGSSLLRHVVRPVGRAGIYVPGGEAVYLSTLIMCAVPARLAGVTDLVVATTPRVAARAEFRFACRRLGVREIYRSGGAGAIAAMAYGTESLRRVDTIVGPGNRYVTAAKQIVFGDVGVDMTAGPSEIVVLADGSADAELAAADLLAQAEHGADAVPLCVTTSEEFAQRLVSLLGRGGSALPRSVETNGAVIVVPSLPEAVRIVNAIAPEHVEVFTRDPLDVASQIVNCGAVYAGPSSGVVFGDYVAGTNHVLPTAGSARFFSPLGVWDFYRRSSVVSLSPDDAAALAPAAALLATSEALPFHARAALMRAEVKV